MARPEDENPAPVHDASARPWRARLKKYWAYWVPILTAVIVIPLATWGRDEVLDWFNPEEYLSAVVRVPSPALVCEGGAGWVFDKDPQQLPALPMNGDLDVWADANGGIPASGNYIEVHLHALNGHKVTIPAKGGIEVRIESPADPLHGTYPSLTGGCGGLIPYRFSLNLDKNPVSVTAERDEGFLGEVPGGVPRLIELPQEITSEETAVWHLAAVTQTCTCEWKAKLNWIAEDGTRGTTEITDNGESFRVAAVTNATHASFDAQGNWH